jgi:16S rRNA (guanine527-N7)-methyltransferase
MEKAKRNLEVILKYFDDFSTDQLKQLTALEALYKDWNTKINVISRKDIDSLYEKHVLHSLAIAAFTNFPAGSKLLDIGTGGGFPGIPLAIFFPEVQFHLVDSIAKKLKVVEAVAAETGLKNLTISHSRVEDIKSRGYDYVVSRAVAPLTDLWTWSNPFFKKRQYKGLATIGLDELSPLPPGLICLKGGDLAKEIAESKTRPLLTHIYDIFPEAYFKEKHLVYVPA